METNLRRRRPRSSVLVSTLALVLAFGAASSRWALGADSVPSSDWWNEVRHRIVESEYHVTWQDEVGSSGADSGWQAPNRGHGFRAWFTSTGVRVVPRERDDLVWGWGLDLVRHGRPGNPPAVLSAGHSVADNRIEFHRGAIEEWFVNTPAGLKHGFTLASSPGDAAAGSVVVLELELRGSLGSVPSGDGRSIDFVDEHGSRILRYGGLAVDDVTGRRLQSRLELFRRGASRGIRIVFDDAEALYPIVVDPLLTSPGWNADGGQLDANFGWSVGSAGDVDGDGISEVIVGARLYDNGQMNEGRAFVYLGSPSGPSLVADWTVEADQARANFGVSVGTAGDVNGDGYSDVIVGAHQYSNGEVNEGRVYVYHGSADGLAATPAWTAEADQEDAKFGRSAGTAGDVNGDGYADVVVGAPGYDGGQTGQGRAWVYPGSADGLSASAVWTTFGGQEGAELGWSVGFAGDVNADGHSDVIVGSRFWDNGELNEGRAQVFHGSVSGLGFAPAWSAEGGQSGARFGQSVATAGDVNGDGYSDVVVGAPSYDNGEMDEGSAFVFLGSDAGLSLVADWSDEADQAGANLGISVGPAGDVDGDGYGDVIVGANLFDNGEEDEGRAWVYSGSARGLSADATWTVESDQAGAELGWSVFTAGDVNGDGYSDVAVGARYHDGIVSGDGRAFVYLGSPHGLSTSAGWSAESDQSQSQFGISVAAAGDVNGDGFDDVLVGAKFFDGGHSNEGRAYIYHGSAAGLEFDNSGVAEIDQASAQFGASVGTAGDVNGDGYSDVIVGAPRWDNGQSDEGGAFLYTGSPQGLSMAPVWEFESNQVGAHLGGTVGTAGDVNGDGYSDVIVGADSYDNGQVDEGGAFVFHGSPSGLATTFSWLGESNQAGAFYGFAAAAGDVNGDGYSDVIVGAAGFDGTIADEGAAFVYHGAPAGLSTSHAWTASSGQMGSLFGFSVWSAGDVNGDGYSEVIVGAPTFENGEVREGAAFVYEGSPAGLALVPSWMTESDQAEARLGVTVATAGDVNGDGYSDVIVGAPNYTQSFSAEGRAWLHHGSAGGLLADAAWFADGGQSGAGFGRSVDRAGDVDADGYSDVVVGARAFEDGQFDEGAAFLFYGNRGPGMNRRPQQRRLDDTAMIAHLGVSDSRDGFRLSLVARSSYGRGPLRIEWEVAPLGVAFDGTQTGVSEFWADGGITGVEFAETLSGLAAETPYHWRARVVYGPASLPFQARGPWITQPRNGWAESDLRTALLGSGEVPDGGSLPGVPLTLERTVEGAVRLTWGDSCSPADDGYTVYQGNLGNFTSSIPLGCDPITDTTTTVAAPFGDAWFLIVPRRGDVEGSYGSDSEGIERPASGLACLPQVPGACD